MNQDNFYKKLRIICLILAIICMGLSLVKRAKAESIDDDLTQRYFEDTFLGASNINDVSFLNSLVTNGYDYFVEMKYNNDINIYWISKGKTAVPFSFDVSNQTISCHHQYNFGSYETYYNATDGRGILEGIGRGGVIAYLVAYNHNNNRIEACSSMNFSSNSDGTIANYNGTGYYNFVQGNNIYYNAVRTTTGYYNIFDSRSIVNITANDTKANYHNYWFKNYLNQGEVLQLDNYFDLSEYYPSYNTPGFECYKLDTKGGIYFYADYSNLIIFDYGIINTSTFSCDVHLDDIVQSISLDSSSEYYQYDVSYREAYYSFPITAFVPNYTDYENVWIDNVKVVNTYSGHGSSYDSTFVYITPVVIQGDAYNDGDLVNPDDVVIPDTNYQPITNIEIAENTYLVEFSNKDGLTFTEFHNMVIPNIYEDNTAWVYMDKSMYSFDDFIEDFLQGSGFDNLVDYITGIHSEDEAIVKMTDYLYDNAFTLTSDIVIFVYIDGDWKDSNFTSDDLTYWVYYTASGRLRAISQLLNSTNTNISRQLSISSGYFNYAKSKLNTIDKNLYEFANSQIGFNNAFVSKMNNVDTILGRIETLLKKILDALQNINIDIPDADYSSITSRLDQIISNQGTGNLNNDWYDDYRSWLYGKDLTDDIISPHEFFIEVFVPIKNTYDAFVNNNAIAGYITDMDLFVEYLSGKIEDNLSIYFKDGIGSTQFDINDNTMLTAGGT